MFERPSPPLNSSTPAPTILLQASYSSEMSMLSCSRSAAVAPVRCSLVMISIRCSLLSKKSPLMAEAEP